MTTVVSHDEVIQAESTPAPSDVDDVESIPHVSNDSVAEQAQDKPERKKEASVTLRDREPGKSILPFSRVQKIMKADKDLPMVARDATFLVSLATEEFIKRLSQACQRLAEKEKRTTVQQRDVANIVHRVDEFLFLEEIVGSQESTGKRRPQKTRVDASGDQDQSQPTLRSFMQKPDESQNEQANSVIMNEDGVMYTE